MSQFHEHNKKISIEQLSKDRAAVTMDGRGVTQTPASTIDTQPFTCCQIFSVTPSVENNNSGEKNEPWNSLVKLTPDFPLI